MFEYRSLDRTLSSIDLPLRELGCFNASFMVAIIMKAMDIFGNNGIILSETYSIVPSKSVQIINAGI